MKFSNPWPALIIISAVAACVAMAGNVIAPLRIILVAWFMLVCPGLAYVRLLQLNHWLTNLMLVIALSLTIDTLVAEGMVLARIWSPLGGLLVIGLLSIVGAALQLYMSRRALPVATKDL